MRKLGIRLCSLQSWLGSAVVFVIFGITLFIAAFGYFEQQQLLGITRNTVQESLPDLLNRQRTADNVDLLRFHGSVVAFDANLADRRRAMAAVQLLAGHVGLAAGPQLAVLLDESVAVLLRLTPDGGDKEVLQQQWTALSTQLGASAHQIAGDSAVRLRRESEHVERVVAESRIRWAVTLVAMGALAWLCLYLRQRHVEVERTFRSLVENTPDSFARFTPQARCTYINPVLQRAFSVSLEEVLGKTPLECHVSERFVRYQQHILNASATGRDSEMDVVLPRPNGGVQHRRIRFVVERDRKGRVAGVIVTGTDTTRLKEAKRQLRQSRDTLRKLMAHQERDREAARKRAAWEVHEELGQNLVALGMRLSILQAQLDRDSAPLQAQVHAAQELLERSVQIVRTVASALRPKVLDVGVVPALEWLADAFGKRSRVAVALQFGTDLAMDEETATAIFRIAEQALDKVARHAGATRVELSLERRGHDYFLCITDDGKGVNLDAPQEQCPGLPRERERSQAFDDHCESCAQCYLLGVQERALALGGEATITRAPGAGTALQVRVPALACDHVRNDNLTKVSE